MHILIVVVAAVALWYVRCHYRDKDAALVADYLRRRK